VEFKTLTGDAANSPITEKKKSEAVTLGVIYRL
jgi:outer membrane scaffolding protein for murein synthesis (MipA/OmpV family)